MMTQEQRERSMAAAINAARSRRGLPPVETNERLREAARGHAADIAAHPGMVHTGSDGSDGGQRARRAGYQWTRWGEIVGWGWNGDIDMMLDWWLSSPEHVGYVLGNWEHMGVGYYYAHGSQWRDYWTVAFGNGGAPIPLPDDAPPPAPSPYVSYAPIVVGGNGNGIDLLDYIRGDGRLYEVSTGERFQTQTDGDTFYLTKNSQWEQFRYDASHIWRGLDTSPGGGRFYVQYEPGQSFARWCPRYMAVGQSWTGPGHQVQFYDKATGRPVDVPWNGRATNRCTLKAHHMWAVFNGVRVDDVIELWANGETYWYARGLGMVAWGSDWGRSAITEIHAPGARPDNVREALPVWEPV